MAEFADVAAVEPGVSAEGFEHLVEDLAAALVGGFAGGLFWVLRWGCYWPERRAAGLRW